MAEVNLPSWSEISQASEGLRLTSTAATWENILARLARIESRLLEHERRAASTRPPLRPQPDPPDGPPLYAASQPQFQITYQPLPPKTHQPLHPHQTYQQQPLKCRATQSQQFPQPNSCWYPSTHQLHTAPQYLSYTGGTTTYSGYELYKQHIRQPPDPEPLYGVPTYGLPEARPQKHDPIQPYTGQPATGWCPLTSHHHTAAPLPAAAVPPCRGCPMEAVAVVVEEDKSCSEFMLFNGKSYGGDGMPMVVPHPLAAISLPCSPDINEEEEELFEEEPSLPAGIPLPCGPNQVCVDEDEVLLHHLEFFQDYSDHTSVPIELVDAREYGHLGERNDRIRVIGDRDRVYEKESLVSGKEEKRTDAFVDVEIIDKPIYTMLEVMNMVEEYNRTARSCTFDPGGDTTKLLLSSTFFVASWFPP